MVARKRNSRQISKLDEPESKRLHSQKAALEAVKEAKEFVQNQLRDIENDLKSDVKAKSINDSMNKIAQDVKLASQMGTQLADTAAVFVEKHLKNNLSDFKKLTEWASQGSQKVKERTTKDGETLDKLKDLLATRVETAARATRKRLAPKTV